MRYRHDERIYTKRIILIATVPDLGERERHARSIIESRDVGETYRLASPALSAARLQAAIQEHIDAGRPYEDTCWQRNPIFLLIPSLYGEILTTARPAPSRSIQTWKAVRVGVPEVQQLLLLRAIPGEAHVYDGQESERERPESIVELIALCGKGS